MLGCVHVATTLVALRAHPWLVWLAGLGRRATCSMRRLGRTPRHDDLGLQPSAFPFADLEDPDMLAYMKRTTIKIPDELDARLRHEAERRSMTISELTREAIEAYLGGPKARRRLLSAGAGSSGFTDTAERIDEILAEGFGRSH